MLFSTRKECWLQQDPVSTRLNSRPCCHIEYICKCLVEMSLLQFGFVRKKRNQGDDNDEGTSEKGGSSKEQRLDESVVPEVLNLSTSSSYESRRVRKFQAACLRDFPWLVHESNKNQMHCKFCVEFPALADKSSPLFNGTSGFRRTTLQAHSRSKKHHTCSEAYRTRENPDAAPMGRALRNMNSQTQEKLRKLTLFY